MGGQLGPVASGCACLACTPKPSSWPRVNGPETSITTSKVAASLPWQASSTAYSSTWSRRASSLSVSARGGYCAYTAGALPRALKLTAGPATWPLGPPAQILDAASTVTGGAGVCSATDSPMGGASPMSNSLSASTISSSISPSTGRHSYTCSTSWPGADWDCLLSWSTLATHSPGTTSSAYQCPPSPPEFKHLQFGMPSGHGTNLEVAGQGTTDTRRVYIPASTCGQVKEIVSYSRS